MANTLHWYGLGRRREMLPELARIIEEPRRLIRLIDYNDSIRLSCPVTGLGVQFPPGINERGAHHYAYLWVAAVRTLYEGGAHFDQARAIMQREAMGRMMHEARIESERGRRIYAPPLQISVDPSVSIQDYFAVPAIEDMPLSGAQMQRIIEEVERDVIRATGMREEMLGGGTTSGRAIQARMMYGFRSMRFDELADDRHRRAVERAEEEGRARARAKETLLTCLTEKQKEGFRSTGAIEVMVKRAGWKKRRPFLIRPREVFNVLDRETGDEYCLVPGEYVPLHDAMLTQKLLLENDPERYFSVANRHGGVRDHRQPRFFDFMDWRI